MNNPISLTRALTDAWERMLNILFRPFDLTKWFVLGFTAWLASFTSGGGGGGGSFNFGGGDFGGGGESSRSLEFGDWSHWLGWLQDNPIWLAVGLFGCAFLLGLILLLFWLGSRGQFMFLDNVLRNRARIAEPWRRYARSANSLFFFYLAFMAVVLVFILGFVLLVLGLAANGELPGFDSPMSILAIVAAVLLFLVALMTVFYLQYFLNGFVVPLMHRYDLGVRAAWSRFGDLFRRYWGWFLLSGLFLLALGILLALAVILFGLLTCCIGFLLLIIPYIGTVVMLPALVVFRAFSVALLDQMDPGYWPEAPAPSEIPAAPVGEPDVATPPPV